MRWVGDPHDTQVKKVAYDEHWVAQVYDALLLQVGMLRGGRLLEEDSPAALITKYGCNTLEDVLLKLCLRQQSGQLPNDDCQPELEISRLEVGNN